ncbi:MAG: hypothetical protein PHY54_15195 [Methylococcales bacterium]|nr:hypothetical protein [Methylococcales bacterium]
MKNLNKPVNISKLSRIAPGTGVTKTTVTDAIAVHVQSPATPKSRFGHYSRGKQDTLGRRKGGLQIVQNQLRFLLHWSGARRLSENSVIKNFDTVYCSSET